MFQYIALADQKPWQPGPYAGVELKILHRNEATGGLVVLRKFAAGTEVPAHVHPMCNEWAYILSGEWVESDVTRPGGVVSRTQGGAARAASGARGSHQPHVV